MHYARVGRSGLEISRLVLGMMSFGNTTERAWHLDLDAARPLVRRAAEAGITAYDTADFYDRGVSEEVTGQLPREMFARRDDYVLSTRSTTDVRRARRPRPLASRHILA
jgi:aryl-alcohol dehydrogenase-like predicted oxidoreductase